MPSPRLYLGQNGGGDGPSDDGKIVSKIVAAETISALKVIYLESFTSGKVGNLNSRPEATVAGIAISSATAGNDFLLHEFGPLEDTATNYPNGTPLFMDANGNITNIPPTTGFRVRIGHSLGNDSMFVKIEEPVIL